MPNIKPHMRRSLIHKKEIYASQTDPQLVFEKLTGAAKLRDTIAKTKDKIADIERRTNNFFEDLAIGHHTHNPNNFKEESEKLLKVLKEHLREQEARLVRIEASETDERRDVSAERRSEV